MAKTYEGVGYLGGRKMACDSHPLDVICESTLDRTHKKKRENTYV
jgi:hypothetical protein